LCKSGVLLNWFFSISSRVYSINPHHAISKRQTIASLKAVFTVTGFEFSQFWALQK
ncbi:MAG: hypothetical protein ACI9A7_001164, partial [Cyclobacteriaceae bacterium]